MELIKALSEIMASPDDTYLDEWSGFGECEDPATSLAEFEALIDEHNGGAELIADGNIYA